MTKAHPVKVYKAEGYLINVRHLTEEAIEEAKDRFTYTFYDEKACERCDNFENRHNETCDNCAAFQGKRQLAKIVERGDPDDPQQLLSLPFGATKKVRAFLKEVLGDRKFIGIDRHPDGAPFSRKIRLVMPEGKTLYDYQEEAIETLQTKKKGLIKAPPRSGKTLTATAFICRLGRKVLIIASQREWLNQFMETFLGSATAPAFTNATSTQVRFCKTYEDFVNTDVCLATPQQFMNPKGKKLLERIRGLFEAIVLDECFTEDHEILTLFGFVPIKQVVDNPQDHSVASVSPEGQLEFKPVVNTLKKNVTQVVRVTIGDRILTCTPTHPFWVESKGAYIQAKDLQPGDKVLLSPEVSSLPSVEQP